MALSHSWPVRRFEYHKRIFAPKLEERVANNDTPVF